MATGNASSGYKRGLSHNIMSHSMAGYLTLGVAPGIFDLTAPWAVQIFTNIYGADVEEIVMIIHGALVAMLTFFGLEKSISSMLVLMSIGIGRYGWRIFAAH